MKKSEKKVKSVAEKRARVNPADEARTTFEDDVEPVMSPENMTQEEAALFLEELIDRCQVSLEALREEMGR